MTEPFGVYVHWPFCAAKCPYCDFNSHVRHGGIDEARFTAAYLKEIATTAERIPGRRVSSVFFGGGTPSLMKPATVSAILEAIARHWTLEDGAEVSLEANPNSADAENFSGYRAAGVNRLSLGVQSLNDVDLKFLGRLHDANEALGAIELARKTFPRLSFDLIYARPDQTLAAWTRELERAIGYAADHLSLYQLTIEPETPFARLRAAGKLSVPPDDRAADLYTATAEICAANGLPGYEISNHAAPGAECRHNLLYWRYGEYAGIGAGAHGRLIEGPTRTATATEPNPERWLDLVERHGHGRIADEVLTAEEVGDEFLLMGLRLAEGVDLARFELLSGRTLSPSRRADLIAHGLVEELGPARLRTTPAGALVLDAVVADLAA
ncbi:oxygen-independent coproporphyrinogen-3 oxidase [Rhodobium orientis]|uniref:Heme chaperone HemW n=1 Tax=Rhodobium orientis TaxID=34017 RepID=A0A327JT69_9HYPH|nr:radical SAM family heme chaperone HemW [Rhodobium orientis]MBB4304317.1 oxygen-independent coproporphyrinogen-3 oxidase [Rhodobium orientis]MBK5948189.1 coproporphyrinogen III oxidase [Rhodobium orientis]RAI28815.1 coproporphyrinogen III oxidase [Rhodobium orientis]